mmetsp:Transcript_21686/g.51558  ORF Transcript_21686/g.51558 Transcript_21686/m.51558 type:complete len:215 (+) Transcript_21686:370-1014(+)
MLEKPACRRGVASSLATAQGRTALIRHRKQPFGQPRRASRELRAGTLHLLSVHAILIAHLAQRLRQSSAADCLHGLEESLAPASLPHFEGVRGLVDCLWDGYQGHSSHQALLEAVEADVRDEGGCVVVQHVHLWDKPTDQDVAGYELENLCLAAAQEVQGIWLLPHGEKTKELIPKLLHGSEESFPDMLAEGLASGPVRKVVATDTAEVNAPPI